MFGSGPDRSAHDPLTGIFMAMRDAWLAGVGLRENMTVQPTAGNPGTGLPGQRRWYR